MGRRTWIKIYTDKWLRGSIRAEDTNIRAVFIDLLALAGDSAYGNDGEIKLAEGVGFTDETIAGILNVTPQSWLSAKELLSNHNIPSENRIKISPLTAGFSIKIINWDKYQSEYGRQKEYRKKVTKRVTKKVTDKVQKSPISISPSLSILFNKETKAFINITEEDKKLWSEAYPACNIDLELKRMATWIVANPAKGKKSNYKRFINSWLSRSQDSGGTKGANNAKGSGANRGSDTKYPEGEIFDNTKG